VNFVSGVLEALPANECGLIELSRDGRRRAWTHGELATASSGLAASLVARGIGRGDLVMTLIGNRPEWVLTMLACFRIGAVVLPCTEQLRSKDLRQRLDVAAPAAVVVDARNLEQLAGAGPECAVLTVPDDDLLRCEGPAPACVDLQPDDPCLITFTSGTSGEPKAVLHGQRYLFGQALQAETWMAVERGDRVWCTASSGWSKSARNSFIAPWLRGGVAVLHDARFDPAERLALIASERVNVLCMAPTEYRLIGKHAEPRPFPDLRQMIAAGEALNPEVLRRWEEATGLAIRDGYGQTETGQLTAMPSSGEPVPGSMGRPLPGVDLWIEDGELVADPETVPTFFLGYLGEEPAAMDTPWRTGDRVREEDGYLYFESRADDVIISAGYRIGPFEVESALITHPAVSEAAVIAAADPERGSLVRAVVTLGDGFQPSPQLASDLQDHVKAQTAPYKYPRVVDFVDQLPKTPSGKIKRSALR
jgi:acyl-coenzyme A synthetase/AMP-(fatty) acid ligase